MISTLRTLVVGGTYDLNGGKPSSLVGKLFSCYPASVEIHNGGSCDQLSTLLNSVGNFDVVFWFPNVDNSFPKLRDVKAVNPKCMLVVSKRNFDEKYCFEELVSRALEVKANLIFEFSNRLSGGSIAVRVFDPLGGVWCDTTHDVQMVMFKTAKRLERLQQFSRQSAKQVDENIHAPVELDFLKIIQGNADVFHDLIQPPEVVKRFLGNASFRCTHGFPSFRTPGDGFIFVSRRNVDKTGISDNDFVPVKMVGDTLYAYGKNKPSVDTPIQVRLYDLLPNVNYMIHSHVYVHGAPFTDEAIPCGAIEEVESIMRSIKKHHIDANKSFCLNLLGHGNTVFATDLHYFDTVEYESRHMPEILA